MPCSFSDIVLGLIPKVNAPEMLSQFHPITLCKDIYKISAKGSV